MVGTHETLQRHGRGLVGPAAAIAMLGVFSSGLHAQLYEDVDFLAHDDLRGRVTGSDGAAAARAHIYDALVRADITPDKIEEQSVPTMRGAPTGVNVIARIDGADPALTDEYILVGAHYDHVSFGGEECTDPQGLETADPICNGATDNATGVAVVLEIARQLARGPAPARSVVFALWDREEMDLGGSAHFRMQPLAPPWPQQPITYVNYDIQGAVVLPELASTTFAIAAESGGATLSYAVGSAAASAPGLTLRTLSEPLGLYLSDYANFVAPAVVHRTLGFPSASLPRIPTVYFTDSRGPCYHTVQDELAVVDFDKLAAQAKVGTQLVRSLASDAYAATLSPYDDDLNERFAAHLARVAGDLVSSDSDCSEPGVCALSAWDPGPIPPPSREDAEELLAVAQTALNHPELDATTWWTMYGQIEMLRMILGGREGFYNVWLTQYPWSWRARGDYRPVEDGVFVALAALTAMSIIESLPCRGL